MPAISIPVRSNGQTIYASWFNVLRGIIMSVYSQITVSITDGQAEDDIDGELYDLTEITSIKYDYEIIRGTTVFANGTFYMRARNGTWSVEDGGSFGDAHGVTFDVNQTSNDGQLTVAADTGAGNGTVKLKKNTFDVA